MSLAELGEIKKAMSPPQLAFLKSKVYQGKMTPAAWLEFLQRIRRYDELADAWRKKVGLWAGLLLGIGIPLTIGGYVVWQFVGLILGAVFLLVPGLFCLINYLTYKGVDVPNRLHNTLLPLVGLLREEMPPEGQLELEIDMTGPLRKYKCVDEETVSYGNPRIEHKYYADKWLAGRGEFADGARLDFTVTDRLRITHKRKTNMRGKTKFKKKEKIKGREFQTRLALPKAEYAHAGGPQPGGFKLKSRESHKRHLIKVKRLLPVPSRAALETMDTVTCFVNCLAHSYRQVQMEAGDE